MRSDPLYLILALLEFLLRLRLGWSGSPSCVRLGVLVTMQAGDIDALVVH